MQRGPENPVVQRMAVKFQKLAKRTGKPVWARIAQLLVRPSRGKRGVNLSKISRFASDGDTVVVPAKVLSLGTLSKKATIAPLGASRGAKEKIEKAGGKIIALSALDEKADTSKIKIII